MESVNLTASGASIFQTSGSSTTDLSSMAQSLAEPVSEISNFICDTFEVCVQCVLL
tara:strand:+ start:132 stop:299 length:168 start_codon:yes stop_codon:yes gene_type:complete